MSSLFRQLVVLATLSVALATGAMAQTEHAALVTFGSNGLTLSEPTDVPIGDAPAALLRMTEAGRWILKTLRPGDIPSEELETMMRFQFPENSGSLARVRDLVRRPTLERAYPSGLIHEVVELAEIDPQRTVLFEITARLDPLEMDDALVNQISEDGALRRLEVSEVGMSGALDARFVFDSLDEWNAWRAAPETTQMLEALRAIGQMQTRMEVRQ